MEDDRRERMAQVESWTGRDLLTRPNGWQVDRSSHGRTSSLADCRKQEEDAGRGGGKRDRKRDRDSETEKQTQETERGDAGGDGNLIPS